jgi:putative heme degradation protein
MTIKIQTTKSNRIRAMRINNPGITDREIAVAVGADRGEVQIALRKGDRRRIKSVAR